MIGQRGILGGEERRRGGDGDGRCTSVTIGGATTNISYDYEDRITSIALPSGTTDTFTYNGVDSRVGKTDSTGTYSYCRDGVDVTDPVLNDSAAEYTPGISESRSGTSAFYHADRLGSTTKISNSSDTVTDTRQYDAFGMLLSSTGSNPTPFGFVQQEGYQTDPDSGLMLLGHRYYDPSTGRFLTRDPAMDGRNWYDYCDNNPLSETDTSGLEADEILDEIRRLIAHFGLPPGTSGKYSRDKVFRERVRRNVHKDQFRGGKGNKRKKLTPEEVKDAVEEAMGGSLGAAGQGASAGAGSGVGEEGHPIIVDGPEGGGVPIVIPEGGG